MGRPSVRVGQVRGVLLVVCYQPAFRPSKCLPDVETETKRLQFSIANCFHTGRQHPQKPSLGNKASNWK